MGRYVQRPSAVVIKPKGDNHEHAVLAGQNWPLSTLPPCRVAPLTRMRSDPGDFPSDLMVEYYSQRASKGGLIISEATPVSIRGYGYAGAPGARTARRF